MGKTLENIARGLALTGVLTFGGCSDAYKTRNLSEKEKQMYSKIYNSSEADWRTAEKEIKPFLSEFSAKREMYIKEAESYPWMNPKNLTKRDKFYITLMELIENLRMSYYQHGGIGGVIMVPDSKK